MSLPIVYLITNSVNGKTYVGVTAFSVEKRWKEHLYKSKQSSRSRLYLAIRKYGAEVFTVKQIASCLSVADAFRVEQDVISTLEPEYNLTKGGQFVVGRKRSAEVVERTRAANTGKQRTAEQRRAMSVLKKQQLTEKPAYRAKVMAALEVARTCVDEVARREAVKVALHARVWSAESRQKLSASREGIRHTREVQERISAKNMKGVECVNLQTTFDSVGEAARATGLSVSGVSRVCLRQRNSANGLIFNFV